MGKDERQGKCVSARRAGLFADIGCPLAAAVMVAFLRARGVCFSAIDTFARRTGAARLVLSHCISVTSRFLTLELMVTFGASEGRVDVILRSLVLSWVFSLR